ncbi:uncharacterized protein LACBIDRAFT_322494 [Laccaria bicolor S238N-H82]|uniref:Predicted protein n=1 Tax=Laccaria bicolor (strain S238N-H82 / ATCC MYA-4686) TaxID=486041 RepID=B0CWH5_LACBS|nr:uncharacterized protein LACBIDRAFT_322494 [Laccaria bicolor S238N-H82]EDR13070.1 predicted protein [Laccaria bicolor S238N-H82]|eukprot:XP_001875568.1 predicted protein [Laccaria bicolor S238N-H82]
MSNDHRDLHQLRCDLHQTGIPDYLDWFVQEEYYKPMAASCGVDQENPFEFNEDSNWKYLHPFIDVFQHCSVQVPKDLYLKYLEEGLLDQSHTIGQPHDLKDLEIFLRSNASHGLIHPHNITVQTVLAIPNYKTTVGPDQFHELTLNQILEPTVDHSGGHPAKVIVSNERDGVLSDGDGDNDDHYNDGDADQYGDAKAALETPWRSSLPKYVMEDLSTRGVVARLEQALQQDVAGASLLDHLPFITESPEVQVVIDSERKLREMVEREDVIWEAKQVVMEASPYPNFNHYETAFKWSKGVLDYHSAKAILDKGKPLQMQMLHPSSNRLGFWDSKTPMDVDIDMTS